jgi:hypothetical protein
MLPLATPVVTAVPFTVTVALAWFTVGVTVIEDTLLATDCVYAIVLLPNVGVSAPLEYVSPDKFASGDDVTYVNSVLAALLPPGVVTTTLAVPAAPAGVVAVIDVALATETLVAATPPIVTPVAPVNPVPVIVTGVPPAVVPLLGVNELTVGAGVTYVNSVLAALLPPGVVTTTLAVPAVPAGAVAVIDVALTTETPVAATPPILTPVAPVNPVPVIVTAVPPAVVPLVGEIDVTVGGTAVIDIFANNT